MRTLFRMSAIAGACLGVHVSGVGAQQIDMDLMARWSAVTVVRYAVVGEYAGEPTILRGTRGTTRTAQVTDRVELTFDWNQNETALVGTPVLKNFPSRVSMTPVAGCPPTRITGAYDHIEVVSAQQYSSVLKVATKRSYPAASIPYGGEDAPCGAAWDDAAAKVETEDIMLLVPPTVYFSMPAAGGSTLSISPDHKSMILADKTNGWTWTYTPTPVR